MLKMNENISAKFEKRYLGLSRNYYKKICLDFNHLFVSYFKFSVPSPWDEMTVFKCRAYI